jgi:DNA-binding GntR family transcriptional regulator
MPDDSLRISPVAAPVRSQVVDSLRRAIISHRFEPGQRLIERELCELTGASRTPVREALRQLESEGLVAMIPNRGPIVAEITQEEAAEIYDVRAALEALAARRFAERATDAEIAALEVAVAEIDEAVEPSGLTDLLELKERFYHVLLEGARNRMIRSMLDPLRTRVSYLRAASLRRPGRPSQSLRELRTILAAIRRRDADAAAEAALQHIERAADAALGSLPEEYQESDASAAVERGGEVLESRVDS